MKAVTALLAAASATASRCRWSSVRALGKRGGRSGRENLCGRRRRHFAVKDQAPQINQKNQCGRICQVRVSQVAFNRLLEGAVYSIFNSAV
jgi:hypothetical protein